MVNLNIYFIYNLNTNKIENNNLKLSEPVQKIFTICGMLVPILSLLVYTFLGLIKPDYNPLLQTISELGEEGGPNAIYASAFFIIGGILLALFSIALYQYMNKYDKWGKFGAILLLIFSIFDYMGSGIFPCDENCAIQNFTGRMHIVMGIVGFYAMWLTPLIICISLKNKEGWTKLNKFFLIMAILIIIFGYLYYLSIWGGLLGLFQRIYYSLNLSWVFILALKVYLDIKIDKEGT